jgi:phosphoribosylformylglycinamidine cyclo-ligase
MLPDGVKAVINKNAYEVPAIFKLLADKGDIAEQLMYNTFNMGIGMVLAIDPADKDKVISALESTGDKACVLGEVVSGEKGVELV